MSDRGFYYIAVLRPHEDEKVLAQNLTKPEAERMKEDWEKTVFNSDVYFDPVPKLKIKKMTD